MVNSTTLVIVILLLRKKYARHVQLSENFGLNHATLKYIYKVGSIKHLLSKIILYYILENIEINFL